MNECRNGIREEGKSPMPKEIDASVGAAACASRGETEMGKGVEAGIFVMGADVGGRSGGERGTGGVGEKFGERRVMG